MGDLTVQILAPCYRPTAVRNVDLVVTVDLAWGVPRFGVASACHHCGLALREGQLLVSSGIVPSGKILADDNYASRQVGRDAKQIWHSLWHSPGSVIIILSHSTGVICLPCLVFFRASDHNVAQFGPRRARKKIAPR